MELQVALALIVALLVCMASGMPVGLALFVGSLVGFLISGDQGIAFLAYVIWAKAANFEFLAAPLFVFMGFLLERAGLVAGIFNMVNAWFGRLPGSTGVVTVMTSGVFAALSGSGAAASAALGTTLGPEAKKNGFSLRLLAGLLNGGASLAPLIPPSLALIIYSTLTEVPLTRLFAAGTVPGLLIGLAMTVYAIGVGYFRPELAPRPPKTTWNDRFRTLRHLPEVVIVIWVTLGGIFLGWFTPTEAAAVGVVVAMLLIVLKQKFAMGSVRRLVWSGSTEAATVAVFLMFIIIGGSSFSAVLSFIGAPQAVATAIQTLELSEWQFLLLVGLIVIVLGMFIDAITIQILTVPFILQTVLALGIDPLWFGIYLVFLIEVGTFTPPYGLHLFVVQGALGVSYKDAVMGALPMIPIWVAGALALILVPGLALWLPSILF